MEYIARNLTHRENEFKRVLKNYDRKMKNIHDGYEKNIFVDDLTLIGLNTRGFMNIFCNASIVSERNENIEIDLLQNIQRFAKSHFTMAYHPSENVTISFEEGKEIEVKAPGGLTLLMDCGSWMTYLSFFLVIRDQEGFDLMMKAQERDFRRSNLSLDKLDLAMINFYKHLNSPSEEVVIETIKATEPFVGNYLDEQFAADYVLNIYEPIIGVYDALFRQNEQLFNEKLLKAIQLHKEYYNDQSEDTDHSPHASDGFISWFLLAPICLAYDRGMKIEVQSDYLPEWLIKREFEL
ncbi:hypothetical protein EI427_23480 [Flammeovirga pectinis]|uniref:Uncharacterized protein n=1 Tax=Flammeovirga pectinis TaxID=2494373 RepID=A0A3S9PAF9_9BACT|nr:immunity 49 family protein [Flammeovirga pectinis]AZQ65178.1 hypothetical protein EI427_23480 [Flammeovirga pectinis]